MILTVGVSYRDMSDFADTEDMISLMQRRIVNSNAKVLVIFEGRGTELVGKTVNSFMNYFEPRGVSYSYFNVESHIDPRNLLRYISREPEDGKIAIFDGSWYTRMLDYASKGIDTSDMRRVALGLEKYFVDNGVILFKVFIDSEDPEHLRKSKKERTFLDSVYHDDWSEKASSEVIRSTSVDYAPWTVVKKADVGMLVDEISGAFLDLVSYRLEHGYESKAEQVIPIFPNPRTDADLSRTLDGEYKKLKSEYSRKLNELQSRLAASDRTLVLVFEGWDAAGKGGTIKRVTKALNPRGYYVRSVSAPVTTEKSHTYLWRFAVSMPKTGHIVIFDRSWYGRMMVEPIEGFCSPEEYGRSAQEIRGFEKVISDAGAVILKFWLEISPDEQLKRFEARKADPVKVHKITDEDWRNREKWGKYEEFVDRMISSTNTQYAPWIVVESESKKYARIKVMKTIVDTLEKELGN